MKGQFQAFGLMPDPYLIFGNVIMVFLLRFILSLVDHGTENRTSKGAIFDNFKLPRYP